MEADDVIFKIGAKLKKLRISAGYSSYENFAIDKDLNRMQYWRMEKGVNVTMKSLVHVLNAHQISLKQFFEEDFE